MSLQTVWAQNFLDYQLKFPTVQEAKELTDQQLKKEFEEKGLVYPPKQLLLQVFKSEAKLEVWVQGDSTSKLQLFKVYDICDMSGTVGPKRKMGDQQVPEGYYKITFFNPESSFFLSMKVGYPNESDKLLSDQERPGDNIFLHGACCSLGCIAIGDNQIAEVYWLAAQVKSSGNDVPIYIYPARMTDFKYKVLCSTNTNSEATQLWEKLKLGYQLFHQNNQLLNYKVNEKGDYIFE